MREFIIFAEGKADIKFIKDFILEYFNLESNLSDDYFYGLGSFSGYKAKGQAIASIKQNFDSRKETILILGADNDFEKRQKEVLADFLAYNIPVHLFLFPNNNLTGGLEDLLTAIAVDRKRIDCFLSYEYCVRDYNLPSGKSRIYAYLDALLPTEFKIHKKNDHRVGENRNYRNPAHWNLHHGYLEPPHDFLSPFFVEAN